MEVEKCCLSEFHLLPTYQDLPTFTAHRSLNQRGKKNGTKTDEREASTNKSNVVAENGGLVLGMPEGYEAEGVRD